VKRENLRQMQSCLSASGVLAEVHSDEVCLVIVPSRRLKSGQFGLLLLKNKVPCRALGHGSGRVRDASGREFQAQGVLALAVERKHARKAELYAKLFGVIALSVGTSPP
jgi:hypothetical protein